MELKIVVVILVTLFVIALIFYRIYEEEIWAPKIEICGEDEVCVRLCCDNVTFCDQLTFDDIRRMEEARNLTSDFRIIKGEPCKDHYDTEARWFLLKNGHAFDLYDEEESGKYIHPTENYCIDDDFKLQVCFEDKPTDRIKNDYPYFMLVSVPFLIITFCVYGAIRELRNLHGKCLMCYVLSLTFLYISLASVQIWHEKLSTAYQTACVVLGYATLMSTLMCFFWLNAMCFDIWSTFRHGRSFDNLGRFLMYCAYAFGIPITLVVIVYLLNTLQLIPTEYASQIGNNTCSVGKDEVGDKRVVRFIYIYLPIIITISINIVFYSITAYKIYRVQKETNFKGGESKRHVKNDVEKMRFFLYVRLFVIMGISWLAELVSWYFDNSLVFFAVSIINCMQGFIIFILFVWKSKVQKLLARKFSIFAGKNESKRSTSTTKTDSMSLEMTTYNLNRFSTKQIN